MKTKWRYIKICLHGKRKLLWRVSYRNMIPRVLKAMGKYCSSHPVPEEFNKMMQEANLEYFKSKMNN